MAHWTDFVTPGGPDGRYLRWREVEKIVAISRTTAWRLQKAGDFPRPYVMSAGRVGYRESEVEAWKASRGHRGPQPRLALSEAPDPVAPAAERPTFQPSSELASRPDSGPTPREPPQPARTAPSKAGGKRKASNGDNQQLNFGF